MERKRERDGETARERERERDGETARERVREEKRREERQRSLHMFKEQRGSPQSYNTAGH